MKYYKPLYWCCTAQYFPGVFLHQQNDNNLLHKHTVKPGKNGHSKVGPSQESALEYILVYSKYTKRQKGRVLSKRFNAPVCG